jgi:hypothetical protein
VYPILEVNGISNFFTSLEVDKCFFLLNACTFVMYINVLYFTVSASAYLSFYLEVGHITVYFYYFFPVGLSKLTHLNLEGCTLTAACLEAISGFASFLSQILCHLVFIVFKLKTSISFSVVCLVHLQLDFADL